MNKNNSQVVENTDSVVIDEPEHYEAVEWETVNDVMKRTKLCRKLIYAEIEAERLSAHKKGKKWLMNPVDVDTWIYSQKMTEEERDQMDDIAKKLIGKSQLKRHNSVRETRSGHGQE